MTRADRGTVVFDLGGVLIDWDPRHLYRKLFAGEEAAMEHFLATICTYEWNRGHCARNSSGSGSFKRDFSRWQQLPDRRFRPPLDSGDLWGFFEVENEVENPLSSP